MPALARRAALGAAVLGAALVASSLTAGPATAGPLAGVRHPIHVMKTLDAAKDGVLPTENRLPLIGGAPVGLPLQYGGGAVETTSNNYALFWDGSNRSAPFSPTYQALISRFFSDVGGSKLFDTVTEYYGGSSKTPIKNVATFGGSDTITEPFPAGGVTDADLQRVVKEAVARNGWKVGVGNEVFVYTAPGGETISSYCAYHSYVTIGGATMQYADEPYGGQSGCTVPGSPNNDPAADSILNTTSHELWETITDPNTGDGWVALSGDEGSDECNFMFGTQDASGADTYMNGHPYLLQQEWRNSLAPFGCTMT